MFYKKYKLHAHLTNTTSSIALLDKCSKMNVSNRFLLLFVLLCLCYAFVGGDDPLAQAKCRAEHHTDVDAVGTQYLNYKCKLVCSIHNQLWNHNYSEGLPCPGLNASTTNMVCAAGECVAAAKLGWIDIEMASAELSTKANAYADVCIQNATTAVTLPIKNRTTCVSCSTKPINGTLHPVWQAVCTGSHTYKWIDGARVTFEVWDQISTTNNNFIGGASLTIQQLLTNGDSHKEIALPLAGGPGSGKIYVRVTWTAA